MKKAVFLILTSVIIQLAFGQVTGYDINNIIVTEGTPNPIEGIEPVSIEKLPADSTLDIVNWNVSFLGAPQKNGNKYGSREEHIEGVAQKLVELNADVYALQEIVVDINNGNALSDLIAKMNQIADSNMYEGRWSEYHSFYWQEDDPEYPSQCLAYVWNKNFIEVNKDSALLQNIAGNNNFGYGRLPYMLDMEVNIRGKQQRYFIINLHLKASGGFEIMRANSMNLLRSLLNANFYTNNIIIAGDYNVADDAGAIGEIKKWGMYNDNEGDGLTDFVHVCGNKNNGIEHILISNELYDELAYISPYDHNVIVDGTKPALSDHYAFMTSLYLHDTASGKEPENNPIFDLSDGFTMVKSDYQLIVDSVNAMENNTHPYPNNSEDYFGASAYYSNFDICDDNSWDRSSFGSWEEAVQTAIKTILLPARYPNAKNDSIIYTINFATWNCEENGASSFQFKCSKAAPNPIFEVYNASSVYEYTSTPVAIFPNPTRNILNIKHSGNNLLVILDILGKQVDFTLLNDKQIDVSNLKTGIYILKTDQTRIKFIKE